MRIEVVLLSFALFLLFMIPGIATLNSQFGWIIFAANTPVAILFAILLMNKLLTGKFTNNRKLWFD